MIGLVDGDMAVYMATVGVQQNVDLDDGLGNTPYVDPARAIQTAFGLIEEWKRKAKANSVIVFFSEGDSFRKRIYPGYKAKRTLDKPLAYWDAVEAVKMDYETCVEEGLEADDLMGIAATSGKADTVIISRDKDMKTVPALVFNPDHDVKPVKIRRANADAAWMLQTMIGDAVDNYPGIPRVGKVTAQQILANPHLIKKVGKKWVQGERSGIWDSMVSYAAKVGVSEEDVIKQAQVARILRAEDFDKERRVVKLWRPNGKEELKLDA